MVAASKRVLVVDDEEIVRESYKLALTEAGYDVRTVPSGREALQACRMEHFDVMLADIRMPDMDGLEVSRVVAREFPDVRVIVITGYPSPESAARARKLGVSDYLQKPVAPDRLSAATAAALACPLKRAPEEAASEMPLVNPPAAAVQCAPPNAAAPQVVAREVPAPVQVSPPMTAAPPPAVDDISAYTAFLVLLGSPLIGLAYFLLFPFVATAIAVTVLGKEIAKLIGKVHD
jgi:CheY-like chemotaxis protein